MKTKHWNRVKAPKMWRPETGDELVGTYLGCQVHSGMFGDYLVYFIQQHSFVYMTSGTQLNDLFALLGKGEPIKLIYTGKKVSKSSGNEYKTFELYSENVVEFKLVG